MDGRGGIPEPRNILATEAFGDAAIMDDRILMLPGRMAGRCRRQARRGRRLAAALAGAAVGADVPVARRARIASFHDRGDLFPVDGLVLEQRARVYAASITPRTAMSILRAVSSDTFLCWVTERPRNTSSSSSA